jgi:hypothetical protein
MTRIRTSSLPRVHIDPEVLDLALNRARIGKKGLDNGTFLKILMDPANHFYEPGTEDDYFKQMLLVLGREAIKRLEVEEDVPKYFSVFVDFTNPKTKETKRVRRYKKYDLLTVEERQEWVAREVARNKRHQLKINKCVATFNRIDTEHQMPLPFPGCPDVWHEPSAN